MYTAHVNLAISLYELNQVDKEPTVVNVFDKSNSEMIVYALIMES
jgi:hypothetical protein